MKNIVHHKYLAAIIGAIILSSIAGYCFVQSQHMEKEYHNTITTAIKAGEKYNNERNDESRDNFINSLKDLVRMYAGIRDREEGAKAYNAKLLCDLLSSSYDILEVDKNKADRLNDLLDGLHMLESDPYDESGMGNDAILNFVKAN